jgi:DNA invertase Pin-like site-specific DNA recombinase
MARAKETTKALAYLRTSSAANVGADKDSETRQRVAIEAFAKRAGYEVVQTFYDDAVSGADLIEERPGFSALLNRIEGNGVRTVIVEDATRFARTVLVQELAILALQARDVRVLASNGDNLTETDDEFKVAARQMATVFAQLEKTRLVKKLKGAQDRKRALGLKVEGRRSYAEARPEVVALAKQLHRRRPKSGQRSLREIADELARAGHLTSRGKPYAAAAVAKMVASGRPCI